MFIGADAFPAKNVEINAANHIATRMVIPVTRCGKEGEICININLPITATLRVHSDVHLFNEPCRNYRYRQVKCYCVIGSQLRT